jgi:arylsulfatase A-like enzyme
MRINYIAWALVVALASLLIACDNGTKISISSAAPMATVEPEIDSYQVSRPNILLIVADDMGYTDLGVYGGEIETPILDQLATEGLILTGFHNQAVCAPTRASILSGTDNRNAGGAMHQAPNQLGVPGYQSNLSRDVVTFPDILSQSGYDTYYVGKWHLGSEPDLTPNARGFSRSFALMQGFASHFSDAASLDTDVFGTYYEDGNLVESLPEDFFSTDFYTDYLIDSIEADAENEKPWFAFLGYTAPHWPLQAPESYIDKYQGRYDEGYEVLREQRIAAGKELGVIPLEAQMYPRYESVPAWEDLSEEEQFIASREMELYSAMVDGIDQNVGRLLDHLKATGEFENTFIVFISDNGAEGSARDFGGTGWDNSLENMGREDSYIYYGARWAQAGVGVGRYHKSYSSEGGTLAPAFIHYPELTKAGQISDEFMSVVDFAPTFLELAGATDIKTGTNGNPLQDLQGYSLLPYVLGEDTEVRPDDFTFGWEIFGHKAIRKGDWKLLWLSSETNERGQRGPNLPERSDHWGLFDLSVDPGETSDRSAEFPEMVADLLVEWDIYMAENGIVLPVL